MWLLENFDKVFNSVCMGILVLIGYWALRSEEFWLKVQLLDPKAIEPTRNSQHAAGYDLYSNVDVILKSGELTQIPLGFATAFPAGWGAMIWDRSGMGARGMIRHAGLLDCDYRGEWKVLLFNHGKIDWEIKRGDRIAQVVFSRVGQRRARIVKALSKTIRGIGGFGSTGK